LLRSLVEHKGQLLSASGFIDPEGEEVMHRKVLAVLVLLLASVPAAAIPVSGSFGVSGSALSDPGLVVEVNPLTGPFSQNLDVGDSVTFDIFDVWTNETTVNADDTVPQTMEVVFDLVSPPGSGTLGGSTEGVRIFFGLFQFGLLVWQNPLEIDLGNTVLSISLSDKIFNFGLFGTFPGESFGATVSATLTLESVPAPASLLLVLVGLGGFSLFRIRRQQSA
jgi:hypothetical protein